MEQWFWNNSETIILMDGDRFSRMGMTKCSPKLQILLDKECEKIWEKDPKNRDEIQTNLF